MKVFGVSIVTLGLLGVAYWAGSKNVLAPALGIFKKAA